MIRVYIAGPYTKPDPAVNVHRAIHVGNKLMDAGFAVFIPHLSHFQHLLCPRPYEDWLAHDYEWLKVCDVVVRLPGESAGAEKECELADRLGIQVIYAHIDRATETLKHWREARPCPQS